MNTKFYVESNSNENVMSIVTMSNDNINLLITVFKDNERVGAHLACMEIDLMTAQEVMSWYK